MQNEPVEVTLKVTGVLEKLCIRYLIGGSLASTLYGMIRTTQDSDIITEMRQEHVQPFVKALQADFFIDEQMIASSIQHHSSFTASCINIRTGFAQEQAVNIDSGSAIYAVLCNIIHRESAFKVDVFIPSPSLFLQSQLARAQRTTFAFEPEASAKFASPEDTVLSKLEWYRLGGELSDRQWRDILGVLKTRAGELDLEYLRLWAKELHLTGLLDRAIKETA